MSAKLPFFPVSSAFRRPASRWRDKNRHKTTAPGRLRRLKNALLPRPGQSRERLRQACERRLPWIQLVMCHEQQQRPGFEFSFAGTISQLRRLPRSRFSVALPLAPTGCFTGSLCPNNRASTLFFDPFSVRTRHKKTRRMAGLNTKKITKSSSASETCLPPLSIRLAHCS